MFCQFEYNELSALFEESPRSQIISRFMKKYVIFLFTFFYKMVY